MTPFGNFGFGILDFGLETDAGCYGRFWFGQIQNRQSKIQNVNDGKFG